MINITLSPPNTVSQATMRMVRVVRMVRTVTVCSGLRRLSWARRTPAPCSTSSTG